MNPNHPHAGNTAAFLPMTPTANWLSAHRETLGASTHASWLMDLDADDMEVYVTPDHALVLVDRSPIITVMDGTAHLRKGVHGSGGTHLSLVNEVESMNDAVLHGVYSGLLGGTAVLMDQYVRMAEAVPQVIVRVIVRVNGTAPTNTFDLKGFVNSLLNGQADTGNASPTKS